MLLFHRIAGIEVLTEAVEATETVAPRAIAIAEVKRAK